MILILVPLVGLYEAGVFLARRFESRDVPPSEPAPEGSG